MQRIFSIVFSAVLLFSFCIVAGRSDSDFKIINNDTGKITIPPGGNSWVTKKAANGNEAVTDSCWINWQHAETIFSIYIGINKAGKLKLSALLNVPEGESIIQCSIKGVKKKISLSGIAKKEFALGTWSVTPGYIKIDVQGVSKTGKVFANINNFFAEGSAIDETTAWVKNNEGNYFYWGRRGPSVHINYDISKVNNDIEWFYNEIKVPEGYDPVGSYFMANGFGEGYFGMQVNSLSERRILFSVWSPFETDDPSKIPDDKKIKLLKKGKEVHTGEFGNEGSGGQSYLKYNWKAGATYRFLLKGEPVDNNYTNYTAWFYAPELKKWLLIASFSRPATHTYLTKLHSFLENFEPSTGYITRKAYYQNQWVADKSGKWFALNEMTFTADATARKGYRKDYKGGADNGSFYLQNCGFFNDSVTIKSHFNHEIKTNHPVIDFSSLE
ncbi:MAG: DUF3472 domain-containing protein [Chitinophagaceae bacterium]